MSKGKTVVKGLENIGQIIDALVRRADDANLPEAIYRGGHTAPVSSDYHAPLHDMTQTYPDDIYSAQAARFYGHGDPALDSPTFDIINRVRGNENAPVTMYRAVPVDAPNEINPGDWVTPNLEYAKQHGAGFDNYKILRGETNAGRLRTDGNSPHEFGYTGNASPALLAGMGITTAAAMAATQDYDNRRAQKSDYWRGIRQSVIDLANSVSDFASTQPTLRMAASYASTLPVDRMMTEADMPLRATMAGVSAINDMAHLRNPAPNASQIINQDSDLTLQDFGGRITDAASPYASPEAAAMLGTAAYVIPQFLSPL